MTRISTSLTVLALLALPQAGFAAGEIKPKKTQTTQQCAVGQIYDADTKACVDARESSLSDDERLDAARELATFGRADDALRVLASLQAPNTSDALTVRGYATRKAGDFDRGVALYVAALELDPQNWLARSYLGQGLVEKGDKDGAKAQLRLIRQGGARGSWPEVELTRAIRNGGSSYSY